MSAHPRLQSLTELVERFLPLQRWGFKQSVQFFGKSEPRIFIRPEKWGMPIVIYDTESCRVKFLFDEEARDFQLLIYYGRLHAPDDQWLMKWNGVDCYCWHSNYHLVLKFLDGITPREAIEKTSTRPEGLKEFKYVLGQDINELDLRIHAEGWEYYGNRLFELFDLRRPELWERYTRFIQEYYDLQFRSDDNPRLDRIC